MKEKYCKPLLEFVVTSQDVITSSTWDVPDEENDFDHLVDEIVL